MILTTDTDARPNKTTMAAANIATMTRTYVFIITRNQKNWTAVDVTWDDSQSGPAGTEFLMVPFDQGRMASRTYDTDSLPAMDCRLPPETPVGGCRCGRSYPRRRSGPR